ncbi:MAG: ABC transporter ATP-binding protein [Leptospiraceae bacterium]|nr:ABC transporter ATP-binding protein [Leptospiraceae bacterium]
MNPSKNVVLKIENLNKTFGDLKAVQNINLEIYSGELFGLLGPNGAGKSTLISMIAGSLRADNGKIYFHGKEVATEDKKTRERVGICPQNLVYWKLLTCKEQLVFMGDLYGLGKKTSESRSLALLEQLGLEAKKNEIASNLSGGMQRRLNILLALMHDPEILILDEPEAGLDPQSRVLVRDFIKSLARKKTVIFTTHNMDEADRICDRIAIIDKGTLIAEGETEYLKNKYGKGEILELEIQSAVNADKLRTSLAKLNQTVKVTQGRIFISGKNIKEKLTEILNIISKEGIHPKEFKIRQDTLEDIFISLTGRSLRE